MLEELKDWSADSDGWITTMDPNIKGVTAAILDALDIPKTPQQLMYSSLLGIPITRGGTENSSLPTASADSSEEKLNQIKKDLFGPDIVSTQSLFNFETSYLYANCSLSRTMTEPSIVGYGDLGNITFTSWGISAGETVNNGNGLTMAYNE